MQNPREEDLLGAELQTLSLSNVSLRQIEPGEGAAVLCSVWVQKSYNRELFKSMMRRLWRTRSNFQFTELGDNLYRVNFADERDKQQILDGRPWLYDRKLVLLREFTESLPHSRISLVTTPLWIQVSGIPYLADKRLVGNEIGKSFLQCSEVVTTDSSLKLKVTVDCREPLRRGLFLQIGSQNRRWISFQYEKLPVYCYLCGRMGHTHRDCDSPSGSGLSLPEAEMPFGSFLRMGTPPMRLREQKYPGARVLPTKYISDEGDHVAGIPQGHSQQPHLCANESGISPSPLSCNGLAHISSSVSNSQQPVSTGTGTPTVCDVVPPTFATHCGNSTTTLDYFSGSDKQLSSHPHAVCPFAERPQACSCPGSEKESTADGGHKLSGDDLLFHSLASQLLPENQSTCMVGVAAIPTTRQRWKRCARGSKPIYHEDQYSHLKRKLQIEGTDGQLPLQKRKCTDGPSDSAEVAAERGSQPHLEP